MKYVYIGLGSNLEDREAYLEQALKRFAASHEFPLIRISPIYETEPVGLREQPVFLNAVCEIRTGQSPHVLLRFIRMVEAELGRQRRIRWGPRTIDLDILVFGDLCVATEELTIPHPRLAERRFVLQPLNDLVPNLKVPLLETPVHELLQRCPDRSRVVRYEPGKSMILSETGN